MSVNTLLRLLMTRPLIASLVGRLIELIGDPVELAVATIEGNC